MKLCSLKNITHILVWVLAIFIVIPFPIWARTSKGRTAEELENPYNWEENQEKQGGAAQKPKPKLTPRVTAAPTPYQRTETDEKREDFYERYFRKGKQIGDGDIPVNEEEQKSLLQQMIPHFTPTAEKDSLKQQITQLVYELGGEHHRRQSAIERLSMIGEPAVPALKKALRDQFKYKRMGALTALGYIQPPDIIQDVQKCLDDHEPIVRQEAVKVLGKMKHRASAGMVAGKLNDASIHVRTEAVIALGRIKGNRAESALIDATTNGMLEVRRLACEELSFFESPQTLDALVKAASDNDRDTCLAAIKSLGEIGDPSVRFELQELTKSSDRMVRQEAIQALSNLE